MQGSYLGKLGGARVGNDKLGALEFNPLPNEPPDNRMALRGIRAYHEEEVSLGDVSDGISHRSASECLGQTGHCGGVSETGTVVYIIGPDYRPGELLQEIILLIGALG